MAAQMATEALPHDGKPSASVMMVDPFTAKRWLERNDVNRHLRPQSVSALARDMLNGDWALTGEAVKFGKSGALLDGQHRLHAICRSGVTVPLFVVRGLPDEVQAQMDSGRKRTAADVLSMDGEPDAVLLAAVARFTISYQRTGTARTGNTDISTSEIRDFVHDNPDVRAACNLARRMTGHLDAKPVVVAYAFMVLSRVDAEHAEGFFTRWHTMAGLAEGDPVLALAQKLAIARRQREMLTHRDELSLIFRAWNASRKRRPLRMLKLRSQSGEVAIPDPV